MDFKEGMFVNLVKPRVPQAHKSYSLQAQDTGQLLGDLVTSFLPTHPGGSKVILQLAGADATSEYDPIHPPGTLEESLPSAAKLGVIDASTLPIPSSSSDTQAEQDDQPPPLDTLLNIDDIEKAATPLLAHKAWAYYYSAADDLHSKTLNNTAYRQILLRPRIFVDCTRCDPSVRLFANAESQSQPRAAAPLKLKLPVFVSPAAMARLAHPSGEAGIAAACARFGAAQIISNNASLTPEQILAEAPADQAFGWQLYVQTQRAKSEAMLARIAKLPQVKFIVLTLDAPVPGKREDDERSKNVGARLPVRSAVQSSHSSSLSDAEGAGLGNTDSGGLGRALFAGTAPDLTWKDTLPWLVQHTSLPIVLKGVQTHEDAYLAALTSVNYPQLRGILLSNHGGRALDTAPPSIHTLLEIRKYCPEVLSRLDVMLDGGIKRGTDVVKALCLGAKAVGIGRAALFGLGVGGPAGVERVLQILQEEVETAMRLLGCERVEQLGPHHVNARALERDIYNGPAGLERQGLWGKARL